MLKLTSILEIGDTAKPYPYRRRQISTGMGARFYDYMFTAEGVDFVVEIIADSEESAEAAWMDELDDDEPYQISYLDVTFSTLYKADDGSWDNSYGTTELGIPVLLRVMATVKAICLEVRDMLEAEGHTIKQLRFTSAREKKAGRGHGGQQREKLYLRYVKGMFPNAKVQKDGADVIVDLPPTK